MVDERQKAILDRYRAYMRRGLVSPATSEGGRLMRANELLIMAMARYNRIGWEGKGTLDETNRSD